MADGDRGQAVVLEHVGVCGCPRTPHASGETVRFRAAVPLAMGSAAMAALQGVTNPDEFVGKLAPIYLRFGIEAWTCRDDRGPLDISSPSIAERFPWDAGGEELVDFADTLYADVILRPLARRIERRLRDGRMEPSIPAIPPSSDAPRPPQEPSSPESTAGSPSGVRAA